MAERPPRVAVIGAGITGLTAAYRLRNADPPADVAVLEASDRTGGELRTIEVGGMTLDAGADSFPGRKPWAADLCRELGIATTRPAASGTWLWTRRGLVEYPTGTAFGIPGDLGDLFRWPGLSGRGRRRALLDLVKRKRAAGAGDESLGGLLRRRLGDEATDLAVAPVLAGLFGGDVDSLSVEATFPEFIRWERLQGSLLRGAQAALRDSRKGTPPPPLFLRPRGGAAALTDVLASRFGSALRLRTTVEDLQPADDGWVVRTSTGPVDADAVVVALDAPAALPLLDDVAPGVEEDLQQIPNVSVGVVLLVYPEGTADRVPAGAGFAAPAGATPMTSCTWTSSVWPDPAFGSRAILRCAIGGAEQEDLLGAADQEIVEACARHIAALIQLPDRPEASAVVRWPAAVPRYRLGHVGRVARIRDRLPAGIFVSGRSFDGLDVAECVRRATETAESVRTFVTSDNRERIR
jgi:protoporphyrinogen/coproporphyrinogen III oxidase